MAFAAERYGIAVHAMCVLSNHWHAVVSDPDAQLPKFLHWVHAYVAKSVNASHGRWENLWASEAASVVRLEGDEDVIDKVVYCLTNPVAAGLVAHGNKWPGVRSEPMDLAGASYEVQRPAIFFREEGSMPEQVTLRYERPEICSGLSDDALAHRIEGLVQMREAAIRDEYVQLQSPKREHVCFCQARNSHTGFPGIRSASGADADASVRTTKYAGTRRGDERGGRVGHRSIKRVPV